MQSVINKAGKTESERLALHCAAFMTRALLISDWFQRESCSVFCAIAPGAGKSLPCSEYLAASNFLQLLLLQRSPSYSRTGQWQPPLSVRP